MPHCEFIVLIFVAVIMPITHAFDEPYELTLGNCPPLIKRKDICIAKDAEDQWMIIGESASFYWTIALPTELGKRLNDSRQNISVKSHSEDIIQGTNFTSFLKNRKNWHASIKLTPTYLNSLLNITLKVNQAQFSDEFMGHLEIKVGEKNIWKTGPVHISVQSAATTTSSPTTTISIASNGSEQETTTSDHEATSVTVPPETSQMISRWDIWGIYIFITVLVITAIVYKARSLILTKMRMIQAWNSSQENSNAVTEPGDDQTPHETQGCTVPMEPSNTASHETAAAAAEPGDDQTPHETQGCTVPMEPSNTASHETAAAAAGGLKKWKKIPSAVKQTQNPAPSHQLDVSYSKLPQTEAGERGSVQFLGVKTMRADQQREAHTMSTTKREINPNSPRESCKSSAQDMEIEDLQNIGDSLPSTYEMVQTENDGLAKEESFHVPLPEDPLSSDIKNV